MPVGIAWAGELEDGWCGDRDGDPVWDDGEFDVVARVLVPRVLAGDGVAHAVAQMDACIPEAYAGKSGSEQHIRLCLEVIGVLDGSWEVGDGVAQGFEGEDVGDGVGALVCWTVDGVVGAWGALVVGNCCPAFEGVAEDV